MENKVYLTYGSNLNIEQMGWLCPTVKQLDKGTLKDYQLLSRGKRNTAVANVAPLDRASVPVLLCKIAPEDE